MLKEIFSKKSLTVHNAIITLGDTDDSGKGRHFKSRFIQPGVAGYPGQFGNVLITKESFDRFINTMVGVPVIINHKDITEKNADDERVGVVNSVWYDDKDGWYWCDGVIWDKTAQNLITDKNWSVSCSYDVKTANDEGGSENNIKYDMEFLDGVFTHLALVNNPRYERANIVFNSKTEILNYNPNHGEDGKFCSSNYSEYLNIIQTDKFKQLDDNLKSAIEFIYCTEPVKALSGKEFQKDEIKLTDKVPEYYAEHYPNGVNNPILGNVKLDKEGVKDSLGHGIGSLKAAAYAAVPEVIEKGYLYDKQTNWKDRGYDSAVIVAPIKIENDDYVCEVVVKTGSKRQGFYLHEVEITNKLADVFKTANGSTSTSSNLIITDKIQKFNPNVKENEEMNVKNGWITTDRVDENGERIKVWIEGASAQPKIYKDWTQKTRNEFLDAERKDGVVNKPKFEYRSKVSDEDKKIIETTFNKLYSEYKMRPVAGIGVMQLAEGTLGVCNAMPPHKYTYIGDGEREKGESKGVSTIALNSQMTRGKYTEEDWQRSKESRFHPDTEGGMLENVLTHEFAHAITANNRDDEFWTKITKIRTEYMKNIQKSDIENPDYVSKYARENKDEFVAECFTQAKLSKKPSKYAKQVLDVINEHYAGTKSAQNSLFNSKDEQIEDAEEWIEAYGLGYPICEEAYDEFKKEQNKEQKNNADNSKETEMALIEELKKLILKVENEKGDDMDDKEKIENEKVDKRKLIDEVGGILKGKVDDEIIRTIIGKLEKVAYDESEAGKADNEKDEEKEVECCKKAKNADDEEEVKEVEEEVEEDVENCGKKAKVKNSKEDYFSKLNEIYNSCAKPKAQTSYVSRSAREQAAVDYFAK